TDREVAVRHVTGIVLQLEFLMQMALQDVPVEEGVGLRQPSIVEIAQVDGRADPAQARLRRLSFGAVAGEMIAAWRDDHARRDFERRGQPLERRDPVRLEVLARLGLDVEGRGEQAARLGASYEAVHLLVAGLEERLTDPGEPP